MNLKQHLIDRGVDFNIHQPILTEDEAYFLLYNLSGQIVGYQKYNPTYPSRGTNNRQTRDRRYYNYVTSGQIGVFGLESYSLNTRVVFVVEGVFDACRLTRRGVCALAMLTNDPSSSMKNFLLGLGKTLVAICDNDKSGNKLRRAAHYSETVIGAKDLGDSPEEYVSFLIKKYNN